MATVTCRSRYIHEEALLIGHDGITSVNFQRTETVAFGAGGMVSVI